MNATIRGNIVQGSIGGAVGVEHGMRLDQIGGSIVISGNQIWSRNGYGIFAAQVGTLANARIHVLDNVFEHSSPHIACIIRGVALAKFSGNTINATSGSAVSVGGDGTNLTRILVWDATNTVLSGAIAFDFAWIGSTLGHVVYPKSPEGLVAAPLGSLYTQSGVAGEGRLWVKQMSDGLKSGWVRK